MATRSRPRRVNPKALAKDIMDQFPKEPHEALKRMREIRGANAIPEAYWSSVAKEISTLAKLQRIRERQALCSCRTTGKRDCPEHGSGDADT